jgi:uncharacterized RDD family membrane protein YckC
MSLPQPFSGMPANVGARLIAFTIDVVLVAAATVAGALLVSPALGAVVAIEALLGLWILQARTGATPGALFLGVRVARADAPYSPGAGRAFVRGSLVLIGGLVLVAGAWIVVASAAWDRSGRRRAWIDKAAETAVLAVPAGRGADTAYALASPTVMGRASSGGRAAPARPVEMPTSAELPVAPEWGAAMVAPVAPTSAPALAAPVQPVAPAQPAPSPHPVAAPAAAPVAPPAAPAAPAGSAQLLVVFDTGQRVQFALPVAVNFGRSPVATEPGDALVTVDDPDRMVSKTHLRLEHDGQDAWVTDAGSTNGSELVDEDGVGRVLAAGVRTALDDGVRVRVGERVFTVSRLIGGPA